MELSKKTKIGGLLKSYPFLLEYLVHKSAKFSKLKNPIMRKTVGSIATIEQAAKLGQLNLVDFLIDIAGQIYKNSGDNITLVNESTVPPLGVIIREERLEHLKSIVLKLHAGASVDEVRKEFHTLLHNVSPAEIGQMEQKLIAEGIDESEIKKLCDLHVELMTSSLAESDLPEFSPGHPLHTFKAENAQADEKGQKILQAAKACKNSLEFFAAKQGLLHAVDDLSHIIRHYERKENQLFPIMEKNGLTAPPQVMWELHDDIRALFKKARKELENDEAEGAANCLHDLGVAICDMIYKEEKILFPMVFEAFSDEDWAQIYAGEEEIGFSWITRGSEWQPVLITTSLPESSTEVSLDRGELTPVVINTILKSLPVDLTFVNSDNKVAYFSQTADRVFPRSAGIIGRDVSKCHPSSSVHFVEKILEKFKAGERDTAEFWLELNNVFIHIRYFAIRDKNKIYLGCLEVSQDVTAIRELQGEQRLLSWK